MDWFNLEEGGGLHDLTLGGQTLPHELLFGCVSIPEPSRCYGGGPGGADGSGGYATTNAGGSSGGGGGGSPSGDSPNNSLPIYDKAERQLLYKHLSDKNDRRQPWSGKLANSFGGARPVILPAAAQGESYLPTLLGSPVVDNLQGSYKGLSIVLDSLWELGFDELEDGDKAGSSLSAAGRARARARGPAAGAPRPRPRPRRKRSSRPRPRARAARGGRE